MLLRGLAFLVAIPATLLPHRTWSRLPAWLSVDAAAFPAGIVTLFAGMAIGIPGFLTHAGANVSMANQAVLDAAMRDPRIGYDRGMVSGFGGLSIVTFLLLTPTGWMTSYLVASGAVRAAAAWFDDPVGDPVLTGLDQILWRSRERRMTTHAREAREALEGPETADRVVSSAKAGIPGCDLVIVTARRKSGWERGVVVYTDDACYRIGDPVERTIGGNLRTLYPLTEHTDLEAIRKSVNYQLPLKPLKDERGGP
jgi:hypothetical protein